MLPRPAALALLFAACNTDKAAEAEAEAEAADAWHPDPSCTPPENTAEMPASAAEYAALCEAHGLGIVPTISCDEAVRVPITVDGAEVFETPASCDNSSMLKPTCDVGSKIGRVAGQDADGTPLPGVIWVYFCRATSGTPSVQMIGYHDETGATCFFEANETADSYLPEALGRDEHNGLTGQMPGPEDSNFDQAFVPPPGQCVQCHQNNPYIRNPWLDGAKLPEAPDTPVLPTLSAASPYYVVGGADWDMRTIHIEDNACLGCHRIGMETDQLFAANGFNVNDYMPPSDPGSMSASYDALLDCWHNGPEGTPGCEWVIPPAGDCDGGTVDERYPYPSSDFNNTSKDDTDPDTDDYACPEDFDPSAPCSNGEKCTQDGHWYVCEDGTWEVY